MSTREIQNESRSSVKISTTAAGKPLVEVKVYADPILGLDVDSAQEKAVALYFKTVAEVCL